MFSVKLLAIFGLSLLVSLSTRAHAEPVVPQASGENEVSLVNTHFVDAASLGGEYGLHSAMEAVLYYDAQQSGYAVIVKRLFSGEVVSKFLLPAQGSTPVAILGLDDISYSGWPDIAVLYLNLNNQGAKLQVVDTLTTGIIHTWSVGGAHSVPVAIKSTPDLTGDGVREISVLNENLDGTGYTEIYDPKTGHMLLYHNYP